MINIKNFLITCLLPLLLFVTAFGQEVQKEANEETKINYSWEIDLRNTWKYKLGDDLDWAKEDYDDSSWSDFKMCFDIVKGIDSNYSGFIWFRKTVSLSLIPEELLKDKPMGLLLGSSIRSAYQVYINGQFVTQRGDSLPPKTLVSTTYQFFPIEIPNELVKDKKVVVAIRYSRLTGLHSIPYGFACADCLIGNFASVQQKADLRLALYFKNVFPGFLIITVFLIAGLYHLQLYSRRRVQKENLWFGLLSLLFMLAHFSTIGYGEFWIEAGLSRKLAILINISLVVVTIQFIWTFCSEPISYKWRIYQISFLFLGIILCFTSESFLDTEANKTFFLMLPIFYSFWVMIKAIGRGIKDVKILLVALIFSLVALVTQTIILNFINNNLDFSFSTHAFIITVITIAIILANRFSRVHNELDVLNKGLEEKVKERTLQLAESEKRANEANKAKSVFLANMSHELRTPLNSILGFSQVITRSGQLPPEPQKQLKMILRSGEHLLGLINDVLSIAKIESGKTTLNTQDFNLKNLLEDSINIFETRLETKSVKLVGEIDINLPTYVHGDEGKLRQILINLLGNAVKFTDKGAITLRAFSKDKHIAFEVADTGQGIAETELTRLFEPFFQTESGRKIKEGSGLGLSISRNFIELMGGEIKVKSELGKGTSFSFSLPLPTVNDSNLATTSKKIIGLTPNQEEYRILIVDDREENRLVLENLLKSVGLPSKQAINGQEAVEIWKSWQPHLIWMDIRMPIKDGYVATAEIRQEETFRLVQMAEELRPKPTVIIALTASVFEQDREKVYSVGCNDLVSKPYQENIIFEKLTKYLGISFIYGEEIKTQPQLSLETGDVASRLAKLPMDLVKKLYNSLLSGNMTAATQFVEQIKPIDEFLALEFETKIKSYKFDEILDIIEQN